MNAPNTEWPVESGVGRRAFLLSAIHGSRWHSLTEAQAGVTRLVVSETA